MSRKKFLSLVGIFLSGIVGFGNFACGHSNPVPIDGGNISDNSIKNAPKEIKSDELKKFSLSFLEENAGINLNPEEMIPRGKYFLSAERTETGAHFIFECDRLDSVPVLRFEKDFDSTALDELQKIIREKNIAAVNGHGKSNSALGVFIDFDAEYLSGETLSVYAKGGASTVPNEWCGAKVFADFFIDKMGIKSEVTSPLYRCSYTLSREDGRNYEITIKVDPKNSRQCILSRKDYRNNDKPTVNEFFLPREKIEELSKVINAYDTKGWKDFPDADEDFSEIESISFGFANGKQIAIDSQQKLPPGGSELIRDVKNFLTESVEPAG